MVRFVRALDELRSRTRVRQGGRMLHGLQGMGGREEISGTMSPSPAYGSIERGGG